MKYLIQFAQTYLTFRLPEFDSLLELNNLKKEDVYSLYKFVLILLFFRSDYNEESPFLVVELPGEDVAKAVDSQ